MTGIKSVRMEVSNGSGMPRAGRAVADEMQMRGFDVYSVKAEPKPVPATTVVDLRSPTGANATIVAQALSVQKKWWRIPLHPRRFPLTVVALDSSRYLEARLVVGQDFKVFFPDVEPLH